MIREKNMPHLQSRSISFSSMVYFIQIVKFNFQLRVTLQHDHRFSQGNEWFFHAYDARLTASTFSLERAVLRRPELFLFR